MLKRLVFLVLVFSGFARVYSQEHINTSITAPVTTPDQSGHWPADSGVHILTTDEEPKEIVIQNRVKFQINDIRAKGVIVRLKTNKERISAYRKEGYKKVADKLDVRTKGNIMMLEYAFITTWSFSPLYFMESQYTDKLMSQDTLIAKTADLMRDTSIYMDHDSVYIIDMGDLMASYYEENHPSRRHESNTAMAGVYYVVKDHDQEQLQPPMPHCAKLWLDEFTNTDKLEPVYIPSKLMDSVNDYFKKYDYNIKSIRKSEAASTVAKYLWMIFEHVGEEKNKGHLATNYPSAARLKTGQADAISPIGVGIPGVSFIPVIGNPFQNAAIRLNKQFIEYFCKRQERDKGIIYEDDRYYWWQRNPNIRYLPCLYRLELDLKQLLDNHPEAIK